ncbi:hypothetical protein OROGR_014443 [Orobanche gracilis]
MALRPIDNELPMMAHERPKKHVKMILSAHRENKLPDLGVNDENKVPLPQQSSTTTDASIDYISSENLQPFQDPDSKIQGLVGGLESKDWLKEKVVLVMVKAMKNPRSALCKTSIMASSDIFKAFALDLLDSTADAFNQLLLQLLLKASQDKKFVCEEADRALLAMVEALSPLSLIHKLSAYARHSNPRIRAKAAVSLSNCVSKMDGKGMEEIGSVALIQLASNLLNDKLPEAREAARRIVLSLYEAITGSEKDDDGDKQELWQSYCQSNLSAIHAQAMVKIVST